VLSEVVRSPDPGAILPAGCARSKARPDQLVKRSGPAFFFSRESLSRIRRIRRRFSAASAPGQRHDSCRFPGSRGDLGNTIVEPSFCFLRCRLPSPRQPPARPRVIRPGETTAGAIIKIHSGHIDPARLGHVPTIKPRTVTGSVLIGKLRAGRTLVPTANCSPQLGRFVVWLGCESIGIGSDVRGHGRVAE